YAETGYKIWSSKYEKVYISRNVKFNETNSGMDESDVSSTSSTKCVLFEFDEEENENVVVDVEENQEVLDSVSEEFEIDHGEVEEITGSEEEPQEQYGRGKRKVKPPERYGNVAISEPRNIYAMNTCVGMPRDYEEAVHGSDKEKWNEAISEELGSMKKTVFGRFESVQKV
ncbi:hypothetical protein U1Q18_049548, partial [Sarracenia purpurea var. burkii]